MKSTDGKLWYVTGDGVQVVDPHHLAFNKVPPPVHIEQVVADHKIYWQNLPGAAVPDARLRSADRLHRPQPGSAGEGSFQVQAEGQDSDWREVVNARQVQYSNLPPGHYRFRVKASNNSGVWNEEGTFLDFSVAPAYWQTDWFRALCAISVLALLWAAYQWRLRQVHHQFEITLDARVDERTRIARDLHDTLLQSFHGVLLRLQTVYQLMRERPMEAQEKLESTIDEVAEAITEGRDAVQGLRESTVQGNDLALAISTLGEEFATDSTSQRPGFRVAVEGEARDLHPILVTRSTGSLPKRCGTRFSTPRHGRLRSKSAMTTSNFDCACGTMERVSIRPFFPVSTARGTMACWYAGTRHTDWR